MKRHSEFTIPDDHPAFAGHFPGEPIVPGVVLLDEALRAIRSDRDLKLDRCRISSAKFQMIVRPGQTLRVEHDEAVNRSIRFTISCGEHTVASGVVTPA